MLNNSPIYTLLIVFFSLRVRQHPQPTCFHMPYLLSHGIQHVLHVSRLLSESYDCRIVWVQHRHRSILACEYLKIMQVFSHSHLSFETYNWPQPLSIYKASFTSALRQPCTYLRRQISWFRTAASRCSILHRKTAVRNTRSQGCHYLTLAQGRVHTKIQTRFSQTLLGHFKPNFV